jgi:hypothetical protein
VNRTLGSLIGLLAAAFSGAAPAPTQEHLSRAEVRRLERHAHTPDDYRLLARYYREKEEEFRRKAEDRQQVLDHLQAQNHTKIPTSAGNAASWREYYSGKARRAGQLAAKYEALLASGPSARLDEEQDR